MRHDPIAHNRGLPFINIFLGDWRKKRDFLDAAEIIKTTLIELGLFDSKQEPLNAVKFVLSDAGKLKAVANYLGLNEQYLRDKADLISKNISVAGGNEKLTVVSDGD